MLLVIIHGHDAQHVASMFGLTRAAARKRLQRARNRSRAALAQAIILVGEGTLSSTDRLSHRGSGAGKNTRSRSSIVAYASELRDRQNFPSNYEHLLVNWMNKIVANGRRPAAQPKATVRIATASNAQNNGSRAMRGGVCSYPIATTALRSEPGRVTSFKASPIALTFPG